MTLRKETQSAPLQNPHGYHVGRVRGQHHPEAGVRSDLFEVVQPLVQAGQPSRHEVNVVEDHPVTLKHISATAQG